MSETIKYPSVTALTGLLPKNLTWWVGNAVAECAFYKQDEWLGLPTREDRYDYVRRAHQRLKSASADLGSQVHEFVEAYNLGKPMPTWPLPVRPRMRWFEQFVSDFRPRIEAAETKVYHEGRRSPLALSQGDEPYASMLTGPYYAGTMDMLAEIDGEMCVIDVKTGKSVWPEAALQINAYAYADFLVADPHHPGAKQITPKRGSRWYEWHGPREDEIPMPGVTKGYVLHLTDDGYSLIPVPIRDDLYEMFLSLFAVDRWEREMKKTVLGEPVVKEAE